MCNAFSYKPKDSLNPYDGDSLGGRITQYVDPIGAAVKNDDSAQLDPWNVRKIFQAKKLPPPPPALPPPQAAKTPSTEPLNRRRGGGSGLAGNGTMLTGSSGVAVGVGNLGANTLLGG